MAKRADEDDFQLSSGNVFADLGLTNADEEHAKIWLALAINKLIEHLTQVEAARQLRTKQPNISALRNYRLDGFSAERLMHFLNALDRDIEIIIRKKPRWRAAGILVTGAGVALGPGASLKRKPRSRKQAPAAAQKSA